MTAGDGGGWSLCAGMRQSSLVCAVERHGGRSLQFFLEDEKLHRPVVSLWSFDSLLVLQQVADLGQQDLLDGGGGGSGRLGSGSFLFLLLTQHGQLVDAADQP